MNTKLLVLVCLLLGLASADLLDDAAPALDTCALSFFQGAASAGSLADALGIQDDDIAQMAEDLERELGRRIREALKEMLDKIKDHVDNGKAVGKELMQKVKELKQKLKDLGEEKGEKAKEVLREIREKAKEALKKILERLGLGKRNLDDSMDQVARLKFSDFVEILKEKLVSDDSIQNLRKYIEEYESNNPLVEKLRELVAGLSDDQLKRVVMDLLQARGVAQRGEAWDRLKNFFKGLNIKLQEHSRKFGEWVKDMWGKGLDKLKDKYGTIKAIAMEFIANSKDMSSEMAREALEFFRPYKDDLGSLWGQIVDATKEVIGKF